MKINAENGFNAIGRNNFANIFANKDVKGKDSVQKILHQLTDTFKIENNQDKNEVISSEMKAKISDLTDTSLSLQETSALLQISENELMAIDETLTDILDLANVVNDGIITDEEDIQNIQKEIENLVNDIVSTIDNAEKEREELLQKSGNLVNQENGNIQDNKLETNLTENNSEIELSDDESGFDIGEVAQEGSLKAEFNYENLENQEMQDDQDEQEELSKGQLKVMAWGLDKIDVTTKEGAAQAVELVTNIQAQVREDLSVVQALQKEIENALGANRHSYDDSKEKFEAYLDEITEYIKTDIFDDLSMLLLAQEENKPEDIVALTE